jgi:kynurenine formamidase
VTNEVVPRPAAAYGSVPQPSVSPDLAGLIRTGRVYPLAYPIRAGGPHGSTASAFSMRLSLAHDEGTIGDGPFAEATMQITMSDHTSTHIDALCHYSEEIDGVRRLFGGIRVADVEGAGGFAALGIEACPPIIARGLLLDVARLRGVDVLPDSHRIDEGELERCCRVQGVTIRPGDCVLIRTGFSRYRDEQPERFATVGAGPTPAACAWLGDLGIALTGADTMSFEQVPSPHLGHLELTRRRGIPILNQVNLDAMATDSVHEFLFVALPLQLVGATASPVSPIAIC